MAKKKSNFALFNPSDPNSQSLNIPGSVYETALTDLYGKNRGTLPGGYQLTGTSADLPHLINFTQTDSGAMGNLYRQIVASPTGVNRGSGGGDFLNKQTNIGSAQLKPKYDLGMMRVDSGERKVANKAKHAAFKKTLLGVTLGSIAALGAAGMMAGGAAAGGGTLSGGAGSTSLMGAAGADTLGAAGSSGLLTAGGMGTGTAVSYAPTLGNVLTAGGIPGAAATASSGLGSYLSSLFSGGTDITAGSSSGFGSGLSSLFGTGGTDITAGGSGSGGLWSTISGLKNSPAGQALSTISNASSAAQLLGSARPQKQTLAQQRIGNAAPNAGDTPQFFPQRPSPLNRPASLNELAGFAPEQERSYLATKGVNSGIGSEEQSYYDNLVQRSLIGDGGQVTADNSNFISPIESQYYSRRGKNTSNVMDFLRQLSA